MEPRTFVCEWCKGTFVSANTEEEKLAEMRDNFGDIPKEERVSLCDECYRRAINHPAFDVFSLIYKELTAQGLSVSGDLGGFSDQSHTTRTE